MKMLRILGRITSINARKVLWAADEMGLQYEHEVWGKPFRDPRAPEFLAMNPNGLVPVIIDDGFVLWESNAILRYLADKAGSDLLPSDARERAVVDQWLTWMVSELNPSWAYIVPAKLRGDPPNPDPDRLAEAAGKWTKAMGILDGHLARTNGYVANGRFSLADIAIGLAVHRWESVAFEDKPDLVAVGAFYDRMRGRPAGAKYLSAATP
jgi:glutathione S-transferase